MNVRDALLGQYSAALTMLREAVEACPEDLWLVGTEHRPYWRIAYHGIMFTDFYLQPSEHDLPTFLNHRENHESLWDSPPSLIPYTKAEMLSYIDHVRFHLRETLGKLDLASPDSGFSWYPGVPKLDHQILNIRHLQGHVGQLSELLMARGIDIRWLAMGT